MLSETVKGKTADAQTPALLEVKHVDEDRAVALRDRMSELLGAPDARLLDRDRQELRVIHGSGYGSRSGLPKSH